MKSHVSFVRLASIALLVSCISVRSDAQPHGISKDLLKAAEKGSPVAQYAVGAAMEEKGDVTGAMGWYQKAASAGYAGAQFRLGDIAEKGTGGDPNPADAIRWYREAAAQEFAPAVAALVRLESESRDSTAENRYAQSTPAAEAGTVEAIPAGAPTVEASPPPTATHNSAGPVTPIVVAPAATPAGNNRSTPLDNEEMVVFIVPYVLLAMWAGENLVEPAVKKWQKARTVVYAGENRLVAAIRRFREAAQIQLLTSCLGTIVGLFGGVLYYFAVVRRREPVFEDPESEA